MRRRAGPQHVRGDANSQRFLLDGASVCWCVPPVPSLASHLPTPCPLRPLRPLVVMLRPVFSPLLPQFSGHRADDFSPYRIVDRVRPVPFPSPGPQAQSVDDGFHHLSVRAFLPPLLRFPFNVLPLPCSSTPIAQRPSPLTDLPHPFPASSRLSSSVTWS